MRTLLTGASLVLLASTASPALAGGGNQGHNGPPGKFSSQLTGNFDRMIRGWWGQQGFGPGFSSGRHFGWFHGHHWGWFKPHNPHWPHHPPASP